MNKILSLITLSFLLAGCTSAQTQPSAASSPSAAPAANLPNPASVYCEAQGYRLEIRSAKDGSQSGVCIFPDDSECDEWAFYRGECRAPANNPIPTATEIFEAPTAMPIDPAGYEGWRTYTHSTLGFTIKLPEDWSVGEVSAQDELMNGHMLNLHPKSSPGKENIRMTFRRKGEATLLWPTSAGQGEFITQGTLDIAGLPAQRVLLVCPGGAVTEIRYHQAANQANIARSNLEFGFIFSAGSHCEAGTNLNGKMQLTGEMIIASLKVP